MIFGFRPDRVHRLWAVMIGLIVLLLWGAVLVTGPTSEASQSTVGVVALQPTVDPDMDELVFLPVVYHAYPCLAVETVTIDGPSSGTIGRAETLTAQVESLGARTPATYTWQIEGEAPVVHQGDLSDSFEVNWDLVGTKTVSVEVTNECRAGAQATHPFAMTTRGLIAFERQAGGENSNHDIVLIYQDGSGERYLTNDPNVDDGAPTWSPDGRYLAFSSDRVDTVNRDKRAIFIVDLATMQVSQLTATGGYEDRGPDWSPDGTKIVFMRDENGPATPDIYVMNADGSALQQLTNWDYGTDFPSWSPDGQWIVFSGMKQYVGLAVSRPDLWVMRADGSEQRVVLRTDAPQDNTKHRRDEIYPSWASNGMIYYTYRWRDYPAGKTEYLYQINPDGSGMQKVFNDTYNRYIPSWSPDGQCFVYYGYQGGGDKEVWKWCQGYGLHADNLTNNVDISDEYCAWSPVP